MIEPRNIQWGSLRIRISGGQAETSYRSDVKVRPGSQSMAKRSWGLPGSWESLLSACNKTPEGSDRYDQDPGPCALAAQRQRTQRMLRAIQSDKKVEETDRGSLSVCIVAIEDRETAPREPVSSQGGRRFVGPLPETRLKH